MSAQTTSTEMYDALHGRTCRRNHEHRAIAGSIKTKEGRISRSSFTEKYTRKFARTVAKLIALHPRLDRTCRVIQQEGQHCAWCNRMGNLVKLSPEHIREVSALEQLNIPQRLNAIPGIEETATETNPPVRTEGLSTEEPEIQTATNESNPEVRATKSRPASSSEEQPDQGPIEDQESRSGDTCSDLDS